MSRPELIEELHQALHSSGVRDGDAHFLLDWIGNDIREQSEKWFLRALWSFLLGFVAGAAACWLAVF